MKKVMTLLIVLISTGSVYATSDGFYISGFGGANWLTANQHQRFDFHSNTGYALAPAVGYRLNDFRFEAEYAYRKNKIRSAKPYYYNVRHSVSTQSYLVNGFWDLPCSVYCFRPFIGGGIGYATHHLHSKISLYRWEKKRSHRADGFAWQVIAGISRPISESVDLSLEYRFFKTGINNLYCQSVGAGLKYYF